MADDRTPATKVVNQSYERQKKIEQKRATENAIQKVSAIENQASGKEELKQKTESKTPEEESKLGEERKSIADGGENYVVCPKCLV